MLNQTNLRNRLEALDERHRMAFSVLLALRVIPIFERSASEGTERLEQIFKQLWEFVQGNVKIPALEFEDKIHEILPNEETGEDGIISNENVREIRSFWTCV